MDAEQNPKTEFLTTQQVSDYLRISLSTVHHLTRTGKLNPVKKGRHWQFVKADIDRYLDSGFPSSSKLSEYDGEEKRKAPRIRCLIQAYLQIDFPEGEGWEGEGSVLNMSESGLFFEAHETLSVKKSSFKDASVIVQMLPEGSVDQKFRVQGKIVREETRNRTRFGIQLDHRFPEILASVNAGG